MTCQERPKDRIFHLCSVFSWALQLLTSESFWKCALPESQSASEFKVTQKKMAEGRQCTGTCLYPRFVLSLLSFHPEIVAATEEEKHGIFCLIFKSNEQSQPWDLLSISENLHTLCYVLRNIKVQPWKKTVMTRMLIIDHWHRLFREVMWSLHPWRYSEATTTDKRSWSWPPGWPCLSRWVDLDLYTLKNNELQSCIVCTGVLI